MWALFAGKGFQLECTQGVFDSVANVIVAKLELYETQKLFKQILNVEEESRIQLELWDLNSPTMESDQMKVDVSLGGKPTLLFEPNFINELCIYVKNSGNDSKVDIYKFMFDLFQK